MVTAGEFEGRRAPYAPISALERFFERIRDRSVPEHVDHKFLQRLNVASNNEYSLLSALKFLGIVDDRGRPEMAYRQLQSTDRFHDTLRHLVENAYAPVFENGANERGGDDLVNFFRHTSSASQAKNAARFFLAVCRMAGIEASQSRTQGAMTEAIPVAPLVSIESSAVVSHGVASSATHELVLQAKAKLLEKLPLPRDDWSAEDYRQVCDRFLEMLHALD